MTKPLPPFDLAFSYITTNVSLFLNLVYESIKIILAESLDLAKVACQPRSYFSFYYGYKVIKFHLRRCKNAHKTYLSYHFYCIGL